MVAFLNSLVSLFKINIHYKQLSMLESRAWSFNSHFFSDRVLLEKQFNLRMKSVVASKAAAALRSIAKPLYHSLPTRSLKESPELCCLTLKVCFTCHHLHSSGCSAFILSHKSHKSQQASFVAAANHEINAFIFVLVLWQIQASLRSKTSFDLKSTNSIITSKYADLQS